MQRMLNPVRLVLEDSSKRSFVASCWTLRTPTELELQQLDVTYTYGHPTEDRKEAS